VQIRVHAISGFVRVDELPVLGWVAPVEEGVVILEGGTVVEVEELATATVEILSRSVIKSQSIGQKKQKHT
jgi:hypothetical protein